MLGLGAISRVPVGGGVIQYVAPSGPLTPGTLSNTSNLYNSTSWALATDSGGTIPYSNQLKRAPHGGSYSNIGSPVIGATPNFTDNTVAPSTQYDYKVTVTDGSSTSVDSNVVTITTPPTPSLTAGTLANTGNSPAVTTWSLATDSGGVPPYSNQLRRAPHGGIYSNIGSPVVGATGNFTDNTVSPLTQYDYKVTVTDFVSSTADSNVVTITTPSASAPPDIDDAVSLRYQIDDAVSID